jgi:leucyl aminopeptidase
LEIRFSTQSLPEFSCDLLVLGTGPDFEADLADLDAQLAGHLLEWLKQDGFDGKAGSKSTLPTLGRIEARQLLVVGVGDGEWKRLRDAAGSAGRVARKHGARSVGLALGTLSGDQYRVAAEMVAAGNYVFDRFKKEADRKPAVESVVFASGAKPGAVTDAGVRIKWQDFARNLVNAPADEIYPETLAERARTLESLSDVSVQVWDLKRCRAEECVGIEAVGRASDRPGCLIHLTYRPDGAAGHVALVGKGVTFDSGGLSLKPGASMQTMRCDMGGAATVIAAFAAAAELQLPISIDCFVGAVENLVSGNSYKLGDVLRYPNGVTVEIHNTDAEGRLVLADCLIQASKVPGVTHIVDAATLTGACVVALGADFTGLFTESDDLANSLVAAADAAGEGLWRMPLHRPYKKLLRADWATIKNVGGREGGAITAALFLQHFVDGKEWAHLDIAGPAFVEKENRHYAPGATGEMVRTLVGWFEGLGS